MIKYIKDLRSEFYSYTDHFMHSLYTPFLSVLDTYND